MDWERVNNIAHEAYLKERKPIVDEMLRNRVCPVDCPGKRCAYCLPVPKGKADELRAKD